MAQPRHLRAVENKPTEKKLDESWDLESSREGYAEHRFYTGSCDARGHSGWMRVRIPTYVEAAMAAAVAGIMELRSPADLARSAIIHYLHYLKEHYPVGGEHFQVMQAEEDRIFLENQTKRMGEHLKGVASTLQVLRKAGEVDVLLKFVAQERAAAAEFREPWRGRILTKLQAAQDWADRDRPVRPRGGV